MKKIKLPLEMANGVMVTKSLEELKANWDLEKVVEHFVTGKLITWLNDRYYTDLAEQVQKITAIGAEAQKQLCAVFGMEFKQDEVVDAEAVSERKRKLDLVRQYTSDDEILENVDSVAFEQDDLGDLLRKGVEKIYLFKNKFNVPINIKNKYYVGLGDVEVIISSGKYINFKELGIVFENIRFDTEYQEIIKKSSKKVGDIIKLGKYGGEEVEWQVLDVKDGRALVLSKYGLDAKPYNETLTDVTWETCSLRKWLNNDFFKSAFDRSEQEGIVISKVTADRNPNADKNPCFDIDPGNDTEDKIFLLSCVEVEKYLENREKRKCYATNYAKNNGAYVIEGLLDGNGCSTWWLRSSGFGTLNPAMIWFDFGIGYGSCDGNDSVVRPAMWVDLSKM